MTGRSQYCFFKDRVPVVPHFTTSKVTASAVKVLLFFLITNNTNRLNFSLKFCWTKTIFYLFQTYCINRHVKLDTGIGEIEPATKSRTTSFLNLNLNILFLYISNLELQSGLTTKISWYTDSHFRLYIPLFPTYSHNSVFRVNLAAS